LNSKRYHPQKTPGGYIVLDAQTNESYRLKIINNKVRDAGRSHDPKPTCEVRRALRNWIKNPKEPMKTKDPEPVAEVRQEAYLLQLSCGQHYNHFGGPCPKCDGERFLLDVVPRLAQAYTIAENES